MTLPGSVRIQLRARLFAAANELGWNGLTPQERSAAYARWAASEEIGGVLSRYMPLERIRVYIKDSLLKSYARTTELSEEAVLLELGLTGTSEVVIRMIKPHSVALANAQLISWGRAASWKDVVVSTYLRCREGGMKCGGLVLTDCSGAYDSEDFRAMVLDIASRLEITHVRFVMNV